MYWYKKCTMSGKSGFILMMVFGSIAITGALYMVATDRGSVRPLGPVVPLKDDDESSLNSTTSSMESLVNAYDRGSDVSLADKDDANPVMKINGGKKSRKQKKKKTKKKTKMMTLSVGQVSWQKKKPTKSKKCKRSTKQRSHKRSNRE